MRPAGRSNRRASVGARLSERRVEGYSLVGGENPSKKQNRETRMTFSLHAVTVGTYLQFLPSVVGLVDKAEQYCRDRELDDTTLTTARLADDMWPFAMQVTVCGFHSLGALEGARAGVFGPNVASAAMASPPTDFATLRSNTQATIAGLEALDADEIDGLVGRDMAVEIGEMRLEFTVEDFFLSFALPNLFFHASTAYGILRNRGLDVGKMDYMGRLRLKG
jgi:hypothetical protein